MAEFALEHQIYNQVCFHAQQGVEKALKACLTVAGQLVPRTHLLVDLFNQLPADTQATLLEITPHLAILDQFYIPTRYPDALPGSLPAGLPGREDAEIALMNAQKCYAVARDVVK
jgi:HEPN domain-containing protein